MIRDFKVDHLSIPGFDRVFSWDDQSGAITGRDAERIIPALEAAKADGATYPPGTAGVPVLDPFRNLGELAVVVLSGFDLPPDVAAAVASLVWNEDPDKDVNPDGMEPDY